MRVAAVCVVVFTVIQSSAQVALTPATPAITPAPVLVPGSPALSTPTTGTALVATNATLTALSASLAILQTNIQQTLPVLMNFNDTFDFVDLAAGAAAAAPAANPPGNFAVNSAPPAGSPLFNTRANAAAQVAAGTSQGVATIPVNRDVLRALLVLQSDMQRMLPVLNALNSGTTNLPGSFAGFFGVPPTSP